MATLRKGSKAYKQEVRVLVACLKVTSRAQGVAREAHIAGNTDATRDAYMEACSEAGRYEKDLFALIGV